jgi:ribosomal protein S12 methylthiotransferase accessory factor
MQGRGLENLDCFEIPTFDMSLVADSFNLESHFIDSNGKLGFGFLSSAKSFAYAPWNYQGEGCHAEFNYLTGILKKMGKEMYLREYSYLGFYSCQMIVPGVSEVYPIEDLIYNNRNIGKSIRTMVLHFAEYNPAEILEQIDSLDDSLDVGRYIGVIFEHSFTMLEFKAQIYLILGETEEALAALEAGTNSLGHVVAELLRLDKEKLVWGEYEEALVNIFGRAMVEKAVRIVKGEEFLIQTTLHRDYHKMLAMYDKLERKKQAPLFTPA